MVNLVSLVDYCSFRHGLCTSYLDSITKNIRNEETNDESDDVKLEDKIQNMKIDCTLETKVHLSICILLLIDEM